MSQENVEVVRRVYAAFAARDWEALGDLWHSDVEYETLGVAPGHLRGFRTITDFFDTWAGLYGEFLVEAEEIVEAGDRVVALERHAARGVKGSQAEGMVGHSFACLFTFRDGKVSQVKEYATREEALEAAGLRE
jgi:ketosteroid isomerase-like protein